jgi:hypothetical protein
MMCGVENIPIGGHERDNVVPLPGAQAEPPSGTEPLEDELEAPERQTPAELARMAEEGLRIGSGFASAAAAALARAFEAAATRPTASDELPEEGAHAPAVPSSVALVAGAAAGLTVELATAAIRAAESAAEIVLPALSWFSSPSVVRKRIGVVEAAASRLNERWSEARPRSEEIAGAFAGELLPQIVDAALDHLDLTELVLERVDLDAIVAKVDLEAVVARIDVNEIAKGIDVEAIVERIDLVGLSRYVIDELDLLELIRQSTETMAVEAAEGVRGQSLNADRYVSALVDRVLRRTRGRDDGSPDPPSAGDDP